MDFGEKILVPNATPEEVTHYVDVQGCIMVSVLLCALIGIGIIVYHSIEGSCQKGMWPVIERQDWRKKQVVMHILWTALCVLGIWGLMHLYINHIALLDLIHDFCKEVDVICGLSAERGSGYPILVNIITTLMALFITFRLLRPRIMIYPEVLYEVRNVEDKHEKMDTTYSHLIFQVWNQGLFPINNLHAELYACKRAKDTGNIHRSEIKIANHDYTSLDWCLAHPDESKMLIYTEKEAFDKSRGFDYLEFQVTAVHPVSNVTKTFTKIIYHENIHRGRFKRKHWWQILSEICYYNSSGIEEPRQKSGVIRMIKCNITFMMIEYVGVLALSIVIPFAYYRMHKTIDCCNTYSIIIELILVIALAAEILKNLTRIPLLEKWQESCLYQKQKE